MAVEYEIRLSGTPFDDGAIDLGRLELLAKYLHDIAKGALHMRIFGTSVKKGRDTEPLSNALKIRLCGLKEGSTVLQLECRCFKDALTADNPFYETVLQRLPDQTPVSLVMESFQDALNPEKNGDSLDRYLLQNLQNFKKIFVSNDHTIQFSNQGSLPILELRMSDFKRIKAVEDQTPAPQPVIIAGIVEELKFSKASVTFIPDKGRPIIGFLGESVPTGEMAKYWGQRVAIQGIAHFKPNGMMSFIEIAGVSLAGNSDAFFSRSISKETVAQQIERQMRTKGPKNSLKSYIGALVDADGSFEDDLKLLNE